MIQRLERYFGTQRQKDTLLISTLRRPNHQYWVKNVIKIRIKPSFFSQHSNSGLTNKNNNLSLFFTLCPGLRMWKNEQFCHQNIFNFNCKHWSISIKISDTCRVASLKEIQSIDLLVTFNQNDPGNWLP